MSTYQKVYFLLLSITLFLSVWKNRGTSLSIFSILLSISLITEIINYTLYKILRNQNIENFIYQIYIPMEFILLTLIFQKNTVEDRKRNMLPYILIIFLFIDILILGFLGFNIFPGQILNVEGFFVTIISVNLLLNLPFHINIPVYKNPLLWIGTGLLLYYSSSFIYNGLYNYLFFYKPQVHNALYNVMMKVPNYLLYIFLSIGFLCPQPTKI